jgi:isoquinoline 1-oxidoreductase beta subunit
VVAEHYWQARRGLAALAPEFSAGLPAHDSRAHAARMHEALETPGVLVYEKPPGAPSLDHTSSRVVHARYDVPLLAHATMEPMNCTASFADGACELWVSTQAVSRERDAVAEALEIAPDRVTVHPMLLGGGFGRRVEADYSVQAALLSRAVGQPVKLIWSREDDIRNDFYRPACAAEFEAELDERGRPLAVRCHVAGPWRDRELPDTLRAAVAWAEKQLGSALAPRSLPDAVWWRIPRVVRSGIEGTVAGAGTPLPYDVVNQRREYSLVDCGVRIGWWRSVAASQHAFFSESFIDELAQAAGLDPFEYRRGLLEGRGRAVLEQAAELAGWSAPRDPGVGLGIAYQALFDSFVCHVAEVRLAPDGSPQVERICCVVDCGVAVSPDALRSQIEGGIVFGLNAALHGRISVEQGRVVQSNFHDYPLLRLAEVPEIEIALRPGGAEPGGAGELATPGVAPAVTNAIFAAGGERIRSLPIISGPRVPGASAELGTRG